VDARVTPFLMFTGNAEEAMRRYADLFADGEVLSIERFGSDEAGAEGTVRAALLRIGGQTLRLFDSPPVHAFSFTPSFSLFVECADAAEVDRLANALADGGAWLMPLGDYGFSPRYAWLNDRFGVSWQITQAPASA
jgi:predicted 3-demethylubiquinone-9 3-methyltransferase (glyoxalase superfamily)